jgi:hypothetical protein
MKHQHGRESAGMIFITRFMNSFLHQASFATGIGTMIGIVSPVGDFGWFGD